MKFPLTFSWYIGKHFLSSVAIALGVVLSVVGMIDFVELIRRTSNKADVSFTTVVEMAFLKLPNMMEEILPYGILIGAMMTLTKLTRSQELVIARASGISVWQFLTPLCAFAFLIGIFVLLVFNPVSSALTARYEMLEDRYIAGKSSQLTVSSSGLWLRQSNESSGITEIFGSQMREYILHASRISHEGEMVLQEVTVFSYDMDNQFIGRIDAERGYLRDGLWQLENIALTRVGGAPSTQSRYTLATDLNLSQIQDSFADPSTLSFWQLTGFINTLENAGFSALRHKVHWHAMFASPLLLAGMVLVAAIFSLRQHRRGGVSVLIISGVAVGFMMNFLLNIFHAFGYSGGLPVMLASWTPPVMALIAGTALLLQLEDG